MEQKTVSAKASAQIRAAVLCGLFAAFTAVFSQISLPIGPVPISCSLIAVYLAGLFLPVKTAALSQLVYLLLGIVGVPVFAGFQSGAARLAGPTGGYLLVYPVMALLLSLAMVIYDKKLVRKPLAARAAYIVSAMLVSLIVCYAAGYCENRALHGDYAFCAGAFAKTCKILTSESTGKKLPVLFVCMGGNGFENRKTTCGNHACRAFIFYNRALYARCACGTK